MPDKTPGEVAYAAYCAAWGSPDWIPAWQSLLPENHRAWEAAAQAVQDRVMQDLLAGGASARQERRARQPEAGADETIGVP